jgi:hypothetical protein
MLGLESFPDDVILHIASYILPHAHLYPLFVSCKHVNAIIRRDARIICTKQLRRMMPIYAAQTNENDPPLLLARANAARQQSLITKTIRAVRTIQLSIRHLNVLAAHPNEIDSTRHFDLFVVHFGLSIDATLFGCIKFHNGRVCVRIEHKSVRERRSYTWTCQPFQSERGDDHAVYVVFPLLSVDDENNVHHDYFLDEFDNHTLSWNEVMSAVSSCACTSIKALRAICTDESVHVPQHACLSSHKISSDARITDVENSTFVRAGIISEQAITPRFLEGFDFAQLDLLWQHMIGIQRCDLQIDRRFAPLYILIFLAFDVQRWIVIEADTRRLPQLISGWTNKLE